MDPFFQIKFKVMFPDINCAEHEACTALGREDFKYPLNNIWGGDPDNRFYKAFKAKVRMYDPDMADILDKVEKNLW